MPDFETRTTQGESSLLSARLRYLCIPLGLTLWGGYVYALFVWMPWTAVLTGVALILLSVYLAIFVWPFEDAGDA